MSLRKRNTTLVILILGVFLAAVELVSPLAKAQNASPQSEPAPGKSAAGDSLQRSAKIYYFKQAAEHGPQRGEEIYYFKCWICHNNYKKDAPTLQGLYERPKLVSGQPVNDETVSAQIRNGSVRMPSYRYALDDADIADLLSYFRGGKCCFNGETPPINPRYHSQ